MDNLVFDHLKAEDSEITFSLRNGDYEYSRNLIISPIPTTLAKEKEWINNLYNDNSKVYFAVRLNEGKKLLGYCFLNQIDYLNRNAKAGVIIDPVYKGKGYGTSSVKFLTEYGLNELGLNKIQAIILCSNQASTRIFEKNKYSKEGLLKRQYFIAGKWEDCFIYSRFKVE